MDTSDLEIFRADGEDAEAIAGIHDRAWHASYGALSADGPVAALTLEERIRRWIPLLVDDGDDAFTLVAERDGVAMGFCSVAARSRDADLPDGTGELAALFVDPAAWGAGVGTALVARALAELGELGCRAVSLWVLAENTRAVSFYRRCGFEPDGMGGPDVSTGRPKARFVAPLIAG